METVSLSPERRWRAISVAVTSSVLLYLLAAFVAEPLRGFAVTSDSSSQVTVSFGANISLNCDGDGDGDTDDSEVLNLGSLDSSDDDTGDYTALGTNDIDCWVSTNNSTGYELSWSITTGSGGVSTGYLINQFEDRIEPIGTQGSAETTPVTWSVGNSDSRWGARVFVDTGSGTDSLNFGALSSNKWARISTGSTVKIVDKTSASQHGDGDRHFIAVRVAVGSSKVQPSGTYYVGNLANANSGIRFTASTK